MLDQFLGYEYKSTVHNNAERWRTERSTQLLAAADLCVKCGLCLQYCPTYHKALEEGDSPRGRIALIQGLAGGQLSVTEGLLTHLGSCLTCRICERVCPSGVRYGRLIDQARNLVRTARPASRKRRWLQWLLAEAMVRRPGLARFLTGVMRRFRDSVAERILRESTLGHRLGLARLAVYRPSLEPYREWREFYPARGREKGQVALFLGCVARAFDRRVLDAAIHVLTRLGYGVEVPPEQGCCGALYSHAGQARDAVRLAARNLDAFTANPRLPVISCASGCGAQLLEYPSLEGLPEGRRRQAETFASQVMDISSFLAGLEWPGDMKLRPLPKQVAIHSPCSLRNVMGQHTGPHDLLARIPGVDLVPLPGGPACCGSAGSYMLDHVEMADSLGDDVCATVADTGAEILVTSNIGCVLHLAARLRHGGNHVRVMHPVVLLSEQMGE